MNTRFKFNNGNGAVLCQRCHKIIKKNITEEEAKKLDLYYCKECEEKVEFYKWLALRNHTRSDEGKLCYCGHTNKCDCKNPTFEMFKEAVKNGTIILNDPNNGWKKYTNNKRS